MKWLAIIMSLRFLTSPTVEAGAPLRARDLAAQSRACNRIKLSGLGDAAWRDVYYCYNAFRQVRNPDELGNFPPEGEWFEIYAHLNPEHATTTWPVADAGDYEGANLSSQLPAFAFGVGDFPSEELRLGDFSGMTLDPVPTSNADYWALGKAQRGVITPSGDQNTPALIAAQYGQYLVYGGLNPHGKSWGGMFPTPTQLAGSCGVDDCASIASYEYFFTAVSEDSTVPTNIPRTGVTVSTNGDGMSVVTYAGSCPADCADSVAGHVLAINRYPTAYIVAVNDGAGGVIYDIYQTSEWIEGPYTGQGEWFRYDGGHISRAVFEFVKEFRGTEAQRNPDTFNIENLSFDNEAFRTRQYHLSPNRGVRSGADLVPVYPTFETSIAAAGKIAKGTSLGNGSRTQYQVHSGFKMTGFYVESENLFEAATVEILVDDLRVATAEITPTAPTFIKYFKESYDGIITVRMLTDARFESAGWIAVEFNEILAYTPDHWDAYMLLRLAATDGGFEGEAPFLDGSGIDNEAAKQLFTNYETYGCVFNGAAAGVRTIEAAISSNPVYEAKRRQINDRCRIINRRQLLTYEVTATKAILRFKRWAYGLSGDQKADYFEGIAPGWSGVDSVVQDEEYVVRSHTGGTIVYRGKKYGHEQRFIGKAGYSTFRAEGDAILCEYNGIKATARKKGWTNEWCCFFNFHPTHPSGSSIWKAEAYSDQLTWINRAHFYADLSGGFDLSLKRMLTQVNTGADADLFSPEGPSSINYSDGLNGTASDDFCKSNRLFPAPYEIESATVEFDSAGEDVVVLTFKTKLQTTDTAPSTRAEDYSTWSSGDRTTTYNETYRTDDNGLAEYLLYDRDSVWPSVKTGDNAWGSVVQILPDNPTGCIIPHIFLSRLERIPYEDSDDIMQDYDSRAIVENLGSKEFFLKAVCEGFVNGFASSEALCDGNSYPYDFLFEDLCVQAFGGRKIGDGHGPLPSTKTRAEHFNQISACLNLLNMVRIDGETSFEFQERIYNSFIDVTPSAGSGSCPPGATIAYWSGAPPGGSLITTGSWTVVSGGLQSVADAGMELCGPGGGGVNAGLNSGRNEFDFRLVPSTAFENALSDELQELIEGNVAIFGTLTLHQEWPSTSTAYPGTGSCATLDTVFFNNTKDIDYGCVAVTNAGTMRVGDPLPGDFYTCGLPEVGNASAAILTFTITSLSGVAVVRVPFEDESLIVRGGLERVIG